MHAGDSRAYLHRDRHLHQLTEDHTLVAELVRKGSLREDEVAAHPLRHVITNVVGGPQAGVTVEARAFDVGPAIAASRATSAFIPPAA